MLRRNGDKVRPARQQKFRELRWTRRNAGRTGARTAPTRRRSRPGSLAPARPRSVCRRFCAAAAAVEELAAARHQSVTRRPSGRPQPRAFRPSRRSGATAWATGPRASRAPRRPRRPAIAAASARSRPSSAAPITRPPRKRYRTSRKRPPAPRARRTPPGARWPAAFTRTTRRRARRDTAEPCRTTTTICAIWCPS